MMKQSIVSPSRTYIMTEFVTFMLQCVAVRCSALQCVAVSCIALPCVAVCCSVCSVLRDVLMIILLKQSIVSPSCNGIITKFVTFVLQLVMACCSALQLVAGRCSVAPVQWHHDKVRDICVAACCSLLQLVAACCSLLQLVAACCSLLQLVAACCSLFHLVAVRCSVSCNGIMKKFVVLQSQQVRDIPKIASW